MEERRDSKGRTKREIRERRIKVRDIEDMDGRASRRKGGDKYI